jgi:hypothetical protein
MALASVRAVGDARGVARSSHFLRRVPDKAAIVAVLLEELAESVGMVLAYAWY